MLSRNKSYRYLEIVLEMAPSEVSDTQAGKAPPAPASYETTGTSYSRSDTFGKSSDSTKAPTAEPSSPKAKTERVEVGDDGEEEESSESSESEDDAEGKDTPLSDDKIKAALAPEGMEREAKQLFLGKEGVGEAEHEWVDRMPMAMSMKASAMSAKERERAKFAILVRMELRPRARFTDDNPVQIHSLVVQSPLIRQVLEKVFDGHAEFNAAENKPVFDKPLAPFVHRWTQLLDAVKTEEDPETKEHLEILMKAIKPELEGTLATRDLCIERDSIMFHQLWMIFEPGSLAFAVKDKSECAYIITKAEIMKNDRGCWFVIECALTDWDGDTYGNSESTLAITIYSGSRKISELEVIPLSIHKRKTDIMEGLLKRGTRFQELAAVKCMVYKGTAIDRRNPSEPRKLYVDGRIVIDSESYVRFNPGENVTITPVKATGESYEEPDYWRRFRQSINFHSFDKKEVSKKEILTEEQSLTCRHLVRGFSLKKKLWLDFQIEGVSDVKWNNTAFDNLILPGDQKNLLLAFAKGQRDSNEEFDDIIEGKGKGMIIQLNGPPGVGKTLSAEAVAETMRVPLYTISAGDLGLDPGKVQIGLSNAFQLARNWSAVLLLDEADVFMEKRSTHDLARNQLVSRKYSCVFCVSSELT